MSKRLCIALSVVLATAILGGIGGSRKPSDSRLVQDAVTAAREILEDAVHPPELPKYAGHHAEPLLGRAGPTQPDFTERDPRDVRRFIRQEISKRLPKKTRASADQLAAALVRAANLSQIDPLLLLAVAYQESSLNPRALGRAGEIGLMQLKLETARWLARELDIKPPTRAQLFEPELNLELGAAYLRYLEERYSGPNRRRHFLKAYNLGPAGLRANRWTDYHKRILKHYRGFVEDLMKSGPSIQSTGSAGSTGIRLAASSF
jgi:soluble lytic murein transglycosylase